MVRFYDERHKISTLQVTLFVFMFEMSNVLPVFNKNCYEFFTFGRYENMVRTFLIWVIKNRVVVIYYGRFGTN
jgi:hypothetical protein